MPRLHRSCRGFSLIEVTISMTLLMIITAITVQTFRRSSVLLVAQSGRLEAQQNG